MPDYDDLVKTLERLRDAIDLELPIFHRHSTGIEVTQAVQYYHSRAHLTDRNDRQPDNSAELVAYKPALVRAYVRPDLRETTGAPISGTLLVERRVVRIGPGIWDTVATLTPWMRNTVTPVADDYADERGSIWNSLNFRIPAEHFAGRLRLTLRLDTGETRTTNVSASLVQTLRVRVLQVRYQGPPTASPPAGPPPPNLNLAAPTLGDAQTTAAQAFLMMPVQQIGSFASAGNLTWNLPLDDNRSRPGGCSTNWGLLLDRLEAMALNDGNRADVVYYGLLPRGIPLGVPGCGKSGIGSGAAGDGGTFAHEIGHGYGFVHTPAGPVGPTFDPNYPVYEPYLSGSIGEYGANINTGAVFSPAGSDDYMSYGRSRWMSLYQHQRLINHPRLAPYWIAERNPLDDIPVLRDPRPWWLPEPPWEGDEIERYTLRPLISVRGTIDEAGTVKVNSVARIVASAVLAGPETAWNAQLVGRSGEVVARARMVRSQTHGCGGCGCGCDGSSKGGQSRRGDPNQLPLKFHAMIPDVELGSALRILGREGKEVWARKAPDAPLSFTNMRAELLSDGATVQFAWRLSKTASDNGGVPFDVWAQYSTDEGKTWRGLTAGLGDGSTKIDIAGVLPAGQVLVRLLAHDGFTTEKSDSVKIRIPERAPYPAILYPADGERVPANVDFEVSGSAVYSGGAPVEDGSLEWLVDNAPFGRGLRAMTLRVSPGGHKLTLRVKSQPGAEVTVAFTARAIE